MTDFIVLIRSDGNGNPVKNGPHGHWVEVTDNQKPVAVNQLDAGGAFPHADCGEACVKAILASRGKPESIVTIEHDSHAGSAGTSAAGVRQALADFGVATTQTNTYPAKDTVPFRVVMNPLGGRIVHSEQAAYKNAFEGTTIVCAVPVAAPKPAVVAPPKVVVTVKPAVAPASAPVVETLPLIDGSANDFIAASAAAHNAPVLPEVLPAPDIPANA
jgi:hypothetical protein